MHVFTGWADSRAAAVQAAHEVYDATRAAAEAGRAIPPRRRTVGAPVDTGPAGPPQRPAPGGLIPVGRRLLDPAACVRQLHVVLGAGGQGGNASC